MGELSLDGSMQPIRGALPIAIEARKKGKKALILPAQNAREAAIVDGLEILGVENIKQVIDYFDKDVPIIPTKIDIEQEFRKSLNDYEYDFSDVKGQENIKLLGTSGFQCNPASINPETGEILFAHCTIPFDMVQHYELDTHYESGIGVGIRGHVQEGPVTILKLSGDMSRYFVAEGELIQNQANPNLCRTQLLVRLKDPKQTEYFLTHPIGNHHVITIGHHADVLKALWRRCSISC